MWQHFMNVGVVRNHLDPVISAENDFVRHVKAKRGKAGADVLTGKFVIDVNPCAASHCRIVSHVQPSSNNN